MDGDDLPEWVPRPRNSYSRGRGRLTRQASSGADDRQRIRSRSGSSSGSSADDKEAGGRTGGAGARVAGGFSLVSLVAGDIVRAQREEAAKRRREKETAASAAANAAAAAAAMAASKAPEQQSKESRLAASENAVAEAVRAAARVVAAEEAARSDASVAARIRKSSIDGMEAVQEAMAALEERQADGSVSESASGGNGQRRGDSRQDVWDSLLQSGPTLSTSRRNGVQGLSRPGASVEGESKADVLDAERSSEGLRSGDGAADHEGVPFSGNDGGGGGLEGEGGRRRRLAPAELQAQLLNELRLHDDLQDAELRADGLMAAQKVEDARREARVAGLLLRRERVSPGGMRAGMCVWQGVSKPRDNLTHPSYSMFPVAQCFRW